MEVTSTRKTEATELKVRQQKSKGPKFSSIAGSVRSAETQLADYQHHRDETTSAAPLDEDEEQEHIKAKSSFADALDIDSEFNDENDISRNDDDAAPPVLMKQGTVTPRANFVNLFDGIYNQQKELRKRGRTMKRIGCARSRWCCQMAWNEWKSALGLYRLYWVLVLPHKHDLRPLAVC